MACKLVMGYRTNERSPLISKKPDNSGLYYDLYSAAAKKIGCDFEIKRLPKKRIFIHMKKGTIDFYPGLNFTEKRARFYYYLENGLPGGDIGISRLDLPDITHLSQLKGKVLLLSLGGPDFLKGIKGVRVSNHPELTLEIAVKRIKLKTGDFYIYNKATIEYFLKKNKVDDIKVHSSCCGGVKPLMLGFSRKSPNFAEQPNPDFNYTKPMSVNNYPIIVKPNTVAYKLGQALMEMKKSGETQKIYDKYYK